MQFSSKLQILREKNNLSYQQLADKLNVSKGLLWQYEKNKSTPSLEITKRISLFFNVSLDYLVFDEIEIERSLNLSE